MRGRPPLLTQADRTELWIARTQAGIAIARLAQMWGLTERRLKQILAEECAKRGLTFVPLPAHKGHLVRRRQVKKLENLPASELT